MTAKEKAQEIKSEYWGTSTECAIIYVKGIIEAIKTTTGHLTLNKLEQTEVIKDLNYWRQVLTELDVK